ncbi:hypothetical protein, partial [Caldisericum sp.]|uniref:hypothetical protein n=1 Tax=Caldisericum sp. TaxID=2499687 RepID=UPI003D0C6474
DVVGLGKTIIACLTAKALGKRGIVICPPHLIGDEAKTIVLGDKPFDLRWSTKFKYIFFR